MRAGGRLQIGFKASQWDVDWATLLATWELAEALPQLDSAWLFDHFSAVRNRLATPERVHEALTAAAALAARTTRLRFGHLVLGNTHRHPAVVARMATTIDHVAGPQRFVLGLGAGWLERDHRMLGLSFPDAPERMTMLESAVRVIKAMWRRPAGASIVAPPYELHDAWTSPPPVTPGGPPLWLGVQGPRGLRLVAELADGWNWNGSAATFGKRRDRLRQACDEVGRDVDDIEISAQVSGLARPWDEVRADAVALVEAGATHLIFVILASDGPAGLQRLVREVANPLRERYG